MKVDCVGWRGVKVGVEYVFGELVLEDEDVVVVTLLNMEELRVDDGTGRAFNLDVPFWVVLDLEPRLGEANGDGVIDVDANVLD